MKRRISSGYGLSLFELVIAIGFFAVFAAVFVRLFFTAHETAKNSADVGSAVIAAQNAAECFKAGTDAELFFDDEWRPTKSSGAAFHLRLSDSADHGVVTEKIDVCSASGETLYTLTVKKMEAAQ